MHILNITFISDPAAYPDVLAAVKRDYIPLANSAPGVAASRTLRVAEAGGAPIPDGEPVNLALQLEFDQISSLRSFCADSLPDIARKHADAFGEHSLIFHTILRDE